MNKPLENLHVNKYHTIQYYTGVYPSVLVVLNAFLWGAYYDMYHKVPKYTSVRTTWIHSKVYQVSYL